jgi:hypothetical protein
MQRSRWITRDHQFIGLPEILNMKDLMKKNIKPDKIGSYIKD